MTDDPAAQPARDPYRERAERLGYAARAGRITPAEFRENYQRMTPAEQAVALAAYAEPRPLPGSPAGHRRTANLWTRQHHRTPAHRPSGEWRTNYPAA